MSDGYPNELDSESGDGRVGEYSDEHQPRGLWSGDEGQLSLDTRRVLLELLKGPFVSGERSPKLWAALIADENLIRSRLNDVFLELVIDKSASFAFTRRVVTDEVETAAALRSERLTFIDTAMLLALRQRLLATGGVRRVIVDQSEIYDQLSVFRTGDESTFQRTLNGAWSRMTNKLRVVHKVSEERYEISPVVRFLIDEDRVSELTSTYARIAQERQGEAQ